jgi:hypothetical protein
MTLLSRVSLQYLIDTVGDIRAARESGNFTVSGELQRQLDLTHGFTLLDSRNDIILIHGDVEIVFRFGAVTSTPTVKVAVPTKAKRTVTVAELQYSILHAVVDHQNARAVKDYTKADAIRAEAATKGFNIFTTPAGESKHTRV